MVVVRRSELFDVKQKQNTTIGNYEVPLGKVIHFQVEKKMKDFFLHFSPPEVQSLGH